MTIYPIVDQAIDEAGKHRIRLDINGNSIMFKYDEMPSEEQLQKDEDDYVNMITPADPPTD